MGRECMDSYGGVKRYCVFAHDELVLKMVNACDRLSISMALAALDEMKEVRECVNLRECSLDWLWSLTQVTLFFSCARESRCCETRSWRWACRRRGEWSTRRFRTTRGCAGTIFMTFLIFSGNFMEFFSNSVTIIGSRVCNTTLFMSSLVCGHDRSVCLLHASHLCTKCPPEECTLQ